MVSRPTARQGLIVSWGLPAGHGVRRGRFNRRPVLSDRRRFACNRGPAARLQKANAALWRIHRTLAPPWQQKGGGREPLHEGARLGHRVCNSLHTLALVSLPVAVRQMRYQVLDPVQIKSRAQGNTGERKQVEG